MNRSLVFISLICVTLFVSCKKNQLGGSSVIMGFVKHHEKLIPNAIVYIKFNAKEFPGTDVSIYNSSFKTDSTGAYSFKCYKGNYYLYATGIDIEPATSFPVTGGIPVRLRSNETVETDVPVFE